MKTLIYFCLVLLSASVAWADCPHEISIDDKLYCLEVNWINGQQKIRGQWQEAEDQSPILIKSGTLARQWVYSRAEVRLWAKGDEAKTLLGLANFRVFPWMLMGHHHNHGTSYSYVVDPATQVAVLSQMALNEMHGCWTLRWSNSADSTDQMATSEYLFDIFDCSH